MISKPVFLNETAVLIKNILSGIKDSIDSVTNAINMAGGKPRSLTITCTSSDDVPVTGVMLDIHDLDTGLLFTSVEYSGQPVTIEVSQGFAYDISVRTGLAHHYFGEHVRGLVFSNVAVVINFKAFEDISSFPELKEVIDDGRGGEIEIGQQFTMHHEVFGDLVWRFSHWDDEDEYCICEMVGCLPALSGAGTAPWDGQTPFDAPEALAGATDTWANGFPAGSYKFKNGSNTYYFTLAEPVPAGGQIRATTSIFYTYESAESFEAIENGSVSTTEIIGATDLGTTGTGELNQMDRVSQGSNDYEESNLRQWLNSYGNAGSWFSPKTRFDRVNENLFTREGFCKGISQDVLYAIDDAVIRCRSYGNYVSPDSTHGKGQPYTVTEKFFLLSEKQVYGSSSYDEGDSQLDIYYDTANADKVKRSQGTTTARVWWLRTPLSTSAYYERYVNNNGSSYYGNATASNGVSPACKISKSS